MREGYYKIIERDISLSNGTIVTKQFINYYNLQKELLNQEFYDNYIRPEYNQPLEDNS